MRLFAPPKPLEERLGKDFFSAVPRCPGVYLMSGSGDRLLYIGESSNLRARLASYKNARPDHAPRKVIRLIHEVHRIVWERCESKEAAKARESELLLTHRPKFNRAGTFPRSDWHITVWCGSSELKLNRAKVPAFDGENFGPFKNGITLHAALVRCVLVAYCGARTPNDFSAGLTHWRIPPVQSFAVSRISSGLKPEILKSEVQGFLTGTSQAILDRTTAALEGQLTPCLRALVLEDQEWLRRWQPDVP